jgi:hypothetical protein
MPDEVSGREREGGRRVTAPRGFQDRKPSCQGVQRNRSFLQNQQLASDADARRGRRSRSHHLVCFGDDESLIADIELSTTIRIAHINPA